ncbi:MAG: type II toxin-antitoxin system VapC family toxin [Actinomycetota bacterium]|nr:type II toxin-antitoxin system VapC family toxin [Actinomycetota bacterium]
MILVDSDVLIAHLRKVPAAHDWLADARRRTGPLGVSVLSITEIAGGMRSAERHEVRRLLQSMTTLPVTPRIAWRASEWRRQYRRSHAGIGLVDYLIATTADVHDLELATLNVRHFPMIEGLTAPFPLR